MIFKPGDQVLVDGNGPFLVTANLGSKSYPLMVGSSTFTLEGKYNATDSQPRLTLYTITDPSITTYHLGKVQTLDNGIQIYHPNEGQPFQLTPTHKELL